MMTTRCESRDDQTEFLIYIYFYEPLLLSIMIRLVVSANLNNTHNKNQRRLLKNHPTEQLQNKCSTDSRNLMQVATTVSCEEYSNSKQMFVTQTVQWWGVNSFFELRRFHRACVLASSPARQNNNNNKPKNRSDEFKPYFHRDASHEIPYQ